MARAMLAAYDGSKRRASVAVNNAVSAEMKHDRALVRPTSSLGPSPSLSYPPSCAAAPRSEGSFDTGSEAAITLQSSQMVKGHLGPTTASLTEGDAGRRTSLSRRSINRIMEVMVGGLLSREPACQPATAGRWRARGVRSDWDMEEMDEESPGRERERERERERGRGEAQIIDGGRPYIRVIQQETDLHIKVSKHRVDFERIPLSSAATTEVFSGIPSLRLRAASSSSSSI
ncbi:hypothetical protein EYF80_022153 [Liparis tanakae]|uniref:Uncharacterized protein n=1 Tax=Liparis tanakae TaxID=230148 RepID=A0A4Z2HPB5_9TELE|nr:hypothetical protein EYF80_022153 [Liparis tanakae]